MIEKLLKDRNLPALTILNDGSAATRQNWNQRREELIGLLSDQVYGRTPPAPERVQASIVSSDEHAFADKAVQQRIDLSFPTPAGSFSFPFDLILPKNEQPIPLFIVLAFRPLVPDRYLPMEEIIDRGYGVATIYYNDVTTDDAQKTGLLAQYPRDEQTGWGKIGMWAFAASRVLDYLLTRSEVDPARVAVTGHSRLGKTALWCGAQDERFSLAISNDSGCSGAAVTRGKVGEDVRQITERFPYWFCGNYRTWSEREAEMPFEQHMLLALLAPRHLYVCSAEQDSWADPDSEFLSACAASEAWALLGQTGLTAPDRLPVAGDCFPEGEIGYHLRAGSHYFSRTDWLHHMDYRDRHRV